MSSINIYTSSQFDNFKPTWLYIKQHNKTGLKYFGKTILDPINYNGSGKHWKRHLKKHGADIVTSWCKLFTDIDELVNYAINFSIENRIVESPDWANLIIENGLDGGGSPSIETRKKISNSLIGYGKGMAKGPFTVSHLNNMSLCRKGISTGPCSPETKKKIAAANKMPTAEFITKSMGIHGNKYNYDKVAHINHHTPVILICPKHGEWYQTPMDHLAGCGCPACGNIKKGISKSKTAFLKFSTQASHKFNNKFIYDIKNYNGARHPMIIICPIHGAFEQIPYVHLRSRCGCNYCLTL